MVEKGDISFRIKTVVHSFWTLTLPLFTVHVQGRARQGMATVRYAYAGLTRLVLVTKKMLKHPLRRESTL